MPTCFSMLDFISNKFGIIYCCASHKLGRCLLSLGIRHKWEDIIYWGYNTGAHGVIKGY